MSRGRGKNRRSPEPESASASALSVDKPRGNLVGTWGAFGLGVALTALAAVLLSPISGGTGSTDKPAAPPSNPQLWRMLSMSDEELAGVDIASLNLLCATGLPGAESLDIEACRRQLDVWAALVKSETDRHLYKFEQNPAEYEGQEGVYRMMMLLTVLQQDLGVHYNMERVRNVDFRRSQDLFIHGMIGNDNGGTCVSMPVLYTAIARRLGYPVKLVLAKAHSFCRWDDGKVRFNIEGTGQGFNNPPDEYYRTWPHPIADVEIERGDYLRSLSPREELAIFLAARGHCLEDNGRSAEAFVAYAHSHELAGGRRENLSFLVDPVGKHAGLSRGRQRGGIDRAAIQADFLKRQEENRLARQRRDDEMRRIMNQNRRNQPGYPGQVGGFPGQVGAFHAPQPHGYEPNPFPTYTSPPVPYPPYP